MPIRKKKTAVDIFHSRHARAALRESTCKFIRACVVLAEARDVLAHGDWIKFCADLGLSRRDAARMIEVGRHERLTDRSIATQLPWDPKIICELARLDEQAFNRLLEFGVIRRDMNRILVRRIVAMTDAGIDVCTLENGITKRNQ